MSFRSQFISWRNSTCGKIKFEIAESITAIFVVNLNSNTLLIEAETSLNDQKYGFKILCQLTSEIKVPEGALPRVSVGVAELSFKLNILWLIKRE
jgi:hypothetical protein